MCFVFCIYTKRYTCTKIFILYKNKCTDKLENDIQKYASKSSTMYRFYIYLKVCY